MNSMDSMNTMNSMNSISLFELFFTRSIPGDLRFSTFATPHVLILLSSAIFVSLTAVIANRMEGARRKKLLTFFTWALPVVYLSRFTVFYLLDIYVEPQMSLLDRLPFHLCALNAIIIPLGISTKNKTLLNYMYAISLPGAAAAMLTPAMSYYGQYFYLSWQIIFFYLDHALMLLTPILAIVCKMYRPEHRYIPRVAALFLPYTVAIYIADKLLNQNWLFLNYPDEGTVIALFAEYLGNPGYLAALALLAVAIVVFMYLPWIIKSRSQH